MKIVHASTFSYLNVIYEDNDEQGAFELRCSIYIYIYIYKNKYQLLIFASIFTDLLNTSHNKNLISTFGSINCFC